MPSRLHETNPRLIARHLRLEQVQSKTIITLRLEQVQSKTIMAVVNSYPVYRLFDFFMLTGTLGLGVCYAIARYLGHVGTFCDISSLVVQLPERIIFRMNFSLVGSLLAAMAFPIHNMLQKRVGG